MRLRSPAFSNNEVLPRKYSCDGSNISPPLEWEDAPEGTRSFALIMDDPDAPSGTFTHWVAYNIPAEKKSLAEDIATFEKIGFMQGLNDFGKTTYGGACPPKGHGAHHYHFKLYALDTVLHLSAGENIEMVKRAMEGHKLAKAELTARYARGG